MSSAKKRQFDAGFQGKNLVKEAKKTEEAKKTKEQMEAAKVYADFVRFPSHDRKSPHPRTTTHSAHRRSSLSLGGRHWKSTFLRRRAHPPRAWLQPSPVSTRPRRRRRAREAGNLSKSIPSSRSPHARLNLLMAQCSPSCWSQEMKRNQQLEEQLERINPGAAASAAAALADHSGALCLVPPPRAAPCFHRLTLP